MKALIKIFSMTLSLVAGWVGAKLVSEIWKKSTGETPPSLGNPSAQHEEALAKVLTFAAISGASAAVIQALTKRWTRQLEAKAESH
ncbi:DUF4235 domain-containing protein [Glutamicibacter sp.]|uniref:DUF4235 domain-containing protein n=1 Tax=Glutamicibacter sp. TaxID=1931995 RepID=UPI0028BDE338|nr:DUF4235 domain-containing protein [Glutamicibacter sp.]